VLLHLSAQLHDLSRHAVIDATLFDRENASTTAVGQIIASRR
jgi:hypothetical protein